MNFLDFIIIAAFIYAGWRGFKKGFIIELFTFLALFMGLYAGIHFSDYLSRLLVDGINLQSSYLPVISFTLIFLAVGAMVYFGGKAIEKLIKVVQLSLLNKLMGLFFSVLKMAFIVGAIILVTEGYDNRNDVIDDETKEASLLFYPIKGLVTACIPAFDESTLLLKDLLLEEGENDEENTPDEGEIE